ncbi:MAG TPA: hypothetical protein VLJ42_09030 [Solirubrobacteraceae bacterium]|nr:hypothetical protein [Solirubrobacteraceae bacterium]
MSTRLRKIPAARALPCAAALLALWLIVDPRTPDLAAQVYRVGLFQRSGFSIWDTGWYGGHHLPGYSLLFAPLASLLGMRVLATLTVLASVGLFERIVIDVYGARARYGALWFAFAAVGDVWVGRLTFALGVAFALAAVRARMSERIWQAAALALVCAAASPVAGLLLALGVVTHAVASAEVGGARMGRAGVLIGTGVWRSVALAAPAVVVVAALALVFPEGGWEPYPTVSFVATIAVVFGFLAALPGHAPDAHGARLLRVGGVLYAAACVLSVLVRTPMGSNVERYGVLLAGPLLVCALVSARADGCDGDGDGRSCAATARDGRDDARRTSVARSTLLPRSTRLSGSMALPWVARIAVLVGIAVWVAWGPVRETRVVSANASTHAPYYAPLKRFLAAHGGALARVEVPLTRAHWEAALLAPSVSLARGWEKQLDEKHDSVLLAGMLSARSYRRWLANQAVAYVALPDVPLDRSSAQEGRLIRRGLSYLAVAFTSRHWVVYRVLDPTPLVSRPGALTALGQDAFTVRAHTAGRLLVRIHYTRYWQITHGTGCVRRARGDWTELAVSAPGLVHVRARFSLRAALGRERHCSPGGLQPVQAGVTG